MIYSKIVSWGHFVPEKIVKNEDLSKFLDTNDEWISDRTGIKERRVLEKDLETSFMAAISLQKALERCNIDKESIDVIIVATSTNDYFYPSCAHLVANKIGIKKNIFCFDINSACSGFVCGLSVADGFIKSGKYNRIAVIGADKNSAILDWTDRNTAVLFGDGAGCVILERYENSTQNNWFGIKDCLISGNAVDLDILKTNSIFADKNFGIKMKGPELMKRAVNFLSQNIKEILEKNDIKPDDVKLFIPHQANYRIINAIADKLHISPEKFFINLNKYGNTSAASVPIAVSEAIQMGLIQENDIFVIEAIGAGLSWGSIIIRL